MDFTLPFELKMMQEAARKFADEELIPLEQEVIENEMTRGLDTEPLRLPPGEHHVFDPDGVLSVDRCRHLIKEAKKRGLWGLDVPEDLGGNEIGVLGRMIVAEEIARSLVPFILPPDSPNLHWMLATCTDEQRARYLEPYARGEISSCIAVTEPNAGSDASAIETTAVRKNGRWVINGRKMFINRADWSDFIIVLAVPTRSSGLVAASRRSLSTGAPRA